MPSDTQDELIALHEPAHCVLAVVEGWTVEFVTLEPEPGKRARVSYVYDDAPWSDYAAVKVYLAESKPTTAPSGSDRRRSTRWRCAQLVSLRRLGCGRPSSVWPRSSSTGGRSPAPSWRRYVPTALEPGVSNDRTDPR